jgi:isoleucyl-tRNA synthetase
MFRERFPADFISEAIDQTRGWFYALLAISTVVHGEEIATWPHPFKTCICLGHIMGEDGTKLSKRLKNYREPQELFDKYSADALRWSFFAKNPPTSTGRLSEHNVEEAQREILIRWYNVWSFFNIYANLDGFTPGNAPPEILRSAAADPDCAPPPAGDGPAVFRPRGERAELDRWILHELDRTILEARESMDAYELNPAARAIAAYIDALSNWYVRRSRARFWAAEWTPDKADAYWTLYECLLTLARLAAPFLPFFSEVTWRNLAAPLAGAAESVHLTRYPEADATAIDRQLLEDMAATREAVRLGLSARRAENIKVRQPLGLCELVVADEGVKRGLADHIELIKEELNIKQVEFTEAADQYVSYEVKPNFKLLGPKYGKRVKAIGQALAAGDGAAFYNALQDGALILEVEGETLELSPGEVEVRLAAKEGFAAAQGKGMVVVLATDITDELRREGWVREFIHCVQNIRKDLGLAYDARIGVTVETGDADLAAAIESNRDAIAKEVLATAIAFGAAGGANANRIEDRPVAIAVTVQ